MRVKRKMEGITDMAESYGKMEDGIKVNGKIPESMGKARKLPWMALSHRARGKTITFLKVDD